MPSKNPPSQWSSLILKGQMTHMYIALQCSLFTEDTEKHTILSEPKISLQIHLHVDSEISTNVFLLNPIHSNQRPKAIHVTSTSPRGSHINSPSPPHPLSSTHLLYHSTEIHQYQCLPPRHHSFHQESKGSPSNSQLNPEELDGEYSS